MHQLNIYFRRIEYKMHNRSRWFYTCKNIDNELIMYMLFEIKFGYCLTQNVLYIETILLWIDKIIMYCIHKTAYWIMEHLAFHIGSVFQNCCWFQNEGGGGGTGKSYLLIICSQFTYKVD